MNKLTDIGDNDFSTVVNHLREIMRVADRMTENGNTDAFGIYKHARAAIDVLSLDGVSRDMLRKMLNTDELFQGYVVSKTVLDYMRANQKINAIKEFCTETGLGLREAKDWVESYMAVHNLHTF